MWTEAMQRQKNSKFRKWNIMKDFQINRDQHQQQQTAMEQEREEEEA